MSKLYHCFLVLLSRCAGMVRFTMTDTPLKTEVHRQRTSSGWILAHCLSLSKVSRPDLWSVGCKTARIALSTEFDSVMWSSHFCHDTCHVPGLASIFHFSFTITSPSLLPVCALEGLLFCDVISLTHIQAPLLRPMTVILGLTHPSSLIYDMTSSSLTHCVLSCLWFVPSYLALDPPYSSPFPETRWTL